MTISCTLSTSEYCPCLCTGLGDWLAPRVDPSQSSKVMAHESEKTRVKEEGEGQVTGVTEDIVSLELFIRTLVVFRVCL